LLSPHDLLGSRLQLAGILRLEAQALNRLKYLRLLHLHRVTELLYPFQMLVQHLQHIRKWYQRFHRRVPGLLLQGSFEFGSLQVLVVSCR